VLLLVGIIAAVVLSTQSAVRAKIEAEVTETAVQAKRDADSIATRTAAVVGLIAMTPTQVNETAAAPEPEGTYPFPLRETAVAYWTLPSEAISPSNANSPGLGVLQTLDAGRSVLSVAFSPDEKLLASGMFIATGDIHDDTVYPLSIWNLRSSTLLNTHEVDSYGVDSVAFSPDGQTLASGSHDGTVRLWNAKDGESLGILGEHTDIVSSVAFSPDGKLLASGSHDQTVSLWNVKDGTRLRALPGHGHVVTMLDSPVSVAFSPNGRTFASGSTDIQLWSTDTDGTPLQDIKIEGDSYRLCVSIAFSPDGQTLACGSDDGIVRLWNAKDGTLFHRLLGHSDQVETIAFSPDGQILASGSLDNTIRLWNTKDGTILCILKEHTEGVNSVAFSPDGKLLASGAGDGSIKLWGIK
jgi:WD40 repeat protein